ncbi:hypothetical protein C8Q80DRAFT_737927 [Daedaleopsis nitida]|nr:hypothetical protein C8Q80DRAFT_737927 [Daedaleopsis nitida]
MLCLRTKHKCMTPCVRTVSPWLHPYKTERGASTLPVSGREIPGCQARSSWISTASAERTQTKRCAEARRDTSESLHHPRRPQAPRVHIYSCRYAASSIRSASANPRSTARCPRPAQSPPLIMIISVRISATYSSISISHHACAVPQPLESRALVGAIYERLVRGTHAYGGTQQRLARGRQSPGPAGPREASHPDDSTATATTQLHVARPWHARL